MKISRLFNLEKGQYELDFVDIDPDRDTPLFLDPYFLSIQTDQWSYEATTTIRSFFDQFITFIRAGRFDEARALFDHFREPNETCLGLSTGRPEGRGIGPGNADDLYASLRHSRAVATGIVEHLEDARIFVDGIGRDKISDMSTNILRAQLIQYTHDQCTLWNMPLQAGIASGYYWSAQNRRWETTYTDRLVVNGRPLLLVPKGIVSFDDRYTPREYHGQFVLEYLQGHHISMNSALVERRQDGTPFVTKKSVQTAEAPLSKRYLLEFTERHPEIFTNFRERSASKMKRVVNEHLTPEELPAVANHLLELLRATPPGPDHATQYHRLIAGILELVFYPNLITPRLEQEIHQGRKRIDLTFANAAGDGVFDRLHRVLNIPCGYIAIECKNYSRDIANPELDQIGGRFAPNRGKVGLVISRSAENLDLLIQRCADTYADDRGLIIPLVDDDLITILEGLAAGVERPEESILSDRLTAIVMA